MTDQKFQREPITVNLRKKSWVVLIARHDMHKPTLFTQPACIYRGRFGISVSFLHVSGAACKPAVSATRRIRFKKNRKQRSELLTLYLDSYT